MHRRRCDDGWSEPLNSVMHTRTRVKFFRFCSLLMLCTLSGTKSDFIERPRTQTVAQGQKGVFTCLYPNVLTGWKLDGNVIPDTNLSAGISRNYYPIIIDGRSAIQHELIIVAQPSHNMTKIECIAYLGGGVMETSLPAFLVIQGPLDPVTGIERVVAINITWHPPYTLDLTAFVIDILYCVEVTNITSQPYKFLFKHCNVSTSYYANSSLRQDSIYKITITSYSNGSSPNNASVNTVIESYGSVPSTETHKDVDVNDTLLSPTNTTVDQANGNSAIAVPAVLLLLATIAGVGIAVGVIVWCKVHNRSKKPKNDVDRERTPASTIDVGSPSGRSESALLLQHYTPSTQKLPSPDSNRPERCSESENQSTPLVQCKVKLSFGNPEGHLEATGVNEDAKTEEPIQTPQDDPRSSALEKSKEEVTGVEEVEHEDEREHTPEQAAVDVVEGGEKEQATGGTDAEHKQTLPEMDPCVLEDGEQKVIQEQSQVESQPVHGGVAESGGGEMDVNTSFIAVTSTRLHVRPDHRAELRQTVIPDSAMILSELDYKAEGVDNMEGGEKPNVDGVGSHGEHVCSPRHRPMDPPKSQAQRAETNSSTTVSVELSYKGDDTHPISGSSVGAFSSETEGLVTDTVTIKRT